MKRFFAFIILFVFVISMFGCTKPQEALPVYKFPVEKDTVESALADAGLDWTVTEETNEFDWKNILTVADKDGKAVVFISTAEKDGRKMLDISAGVTDKENDRYRPIYEEEWEKVITFGTILYGGFYGEKQVYDSFIKEYPDKNVEIGTTQHISNGEKTEGENIIRLWKGEVNDIFVTVRTNQPDPGQEEYLLYAVRFDNTEYM